jgi:hypothetical protein
MFITDVKQSLKMILQGFCIFKIMTESGQYTCCYCTYNSQLLFSVTPLFCTYIMSYLPQFSFHSSTTPAADFMQWLLWKSEIDVSQTIFCSLQGDYNFPVATSVQASESIG